MKRSIVLKCPACDFTISLGGRVACIDCLTPHHEECFLSNEGCAVEGCSSRTSIERGGARREAPPPAPAPVATAETAPAKSRTLVLVKVDLPSPREYQLGLLLGTAVFAYVGWELYAVYVTQKTLFSLKYVSVAFSCGLGALFAAVALKMALFDDHWVLDPAARMIRESRRFLFFKRVRPLLSYDEVRELEVTRQPHRNEKGEIYHHTEKYRLITKDGGEHSLDDATFMDQRDIHVGSCRDHLDDFAQQLGVPVKVVELPAIELTRPGSR